MGAFFLIAGYFSPGSFDRKGVGTFIKDKLIRLGIQLLVFYFVLSSIAFIGYFLMPPEMTGITAPLTWAVFWKAYPEFIGLGPEFTGVAGCGWFCSCSIGSVILFPLAFSGQLFSLELSAVLDNAMGNGHWQSAVYTLWDSIFAVGICLGMITFFRRFFNQGNWFGSFLAQQSYTVYIIHIPIVVFVAYGIRGIAVDPIVKFGLASLVIVPVCVAVAAFVRKIPGVSKVL